MSATVRIFTDGSCLKSGNSGYGRGGWGAVLLYGPHQRDLCGAIADTTPQRMEVLAAVEALSFLKRPCPVVLTSDSKYLIDGARKWLEGWRNQGWRKANGDEIAHMDLWQDLARLIDTHSIEWRWVKGHAGHTYNERANELAIAAASGRVRSIA